MAHRPHPLVTACAAALAALAASAGCRSDPSHATSASSATGRTTATTVVPTNATVVAVVDGDTIEVRVDGRRERVRLIGVDTPETVAPQQPVECWGPEASALTKSLLPAGTAVRLERDQEARDAYGRLLAYVYRGVDGLFVNLELARQGAAEVLSIRPNTAHADAIGQAVSEARRAGRGLWGTCPAAPT